MERHAGNMVLISHVVLLTKDNISCASKTPLYQVGAGNVRNFLISLTLAPSAPVTGLSSGRNAPHFTA
jgi:hypothetical protein